MEQTGRDQQDLLGHVAVEGAIVEQVVEEGTAVVQVDLWVIDLVAAEEQADLEGASVVQVGLATVEGVH